MNKNQDHNDAFEDFYKSKFDGAEMDIPTGLVDSLMDSMPQEPSPQNKQQSFSQRMGTTKLWRALKVSLLLNLITINIVGYYMFFAPEKTIIINTPIESILITQPTTDSISNNKGGELEKMPSTVQSPTDRNQTEAHHSKNILNQTTVDKRPDDVDAVIVDSLNSDTQDTTKKEILETKKEIQPTLKTGPKDLEAYRKAMQDSLDGRKLFE